MSFKWIFYPDPLDSTCKGIHDDFPTLTFQASPAVEPGGRVGQMFIFPENTPSGHGFRVIISNPTTIVVDDMKGVLYVDNGQVPMTYRSGSTAELILDDFKLPIITTPVPNPPNPTPPGPTPGMSPLEIVNATYAAGHYDLNTKDGCGKFTEDCCNNLHNLNDKDWGNIKKFPPQNNYNGHAVDAVMLLIDSGPTKAGVYDLIFSSESPQAHPVFNLAGPPNQSLWYYPA